MSERDNKAGALRGEGVRMRIKAEVLGVETTGDRLAVRLQGEADGSAEWRDMLRISIEVPCNEVTQRTYHVGRVVSIEVKPRKGGAS